jgi:hypothetical protein
MALCELVWGSGPSPNKLRNKAIWMCECGESQEQGAPDEEERPEADSLRAGRGGWQRERVSAAMAGDPDRDG